MNVEIYRHKLDVNILYLWAYYDSKNIFYNVKGGQSRPAMKTYRSISQDKSYHKVELSDLSPKAKEMILSDFPELAEKDLFEDFCNQYQVS